MGIIKQLREDVGWTQDEAAEQLYVSKSTLQNWERDDEVPRQQLPSLFEVYNVPEGKRKELVLQMNSDAIKSIKDTSDDESRWPLFLGEEALEMYKKASAATFSEEEVELLATAIAYNALDWKSDEQQQIQMVTQIPFEILLSLGGLVKAYRKIYELDLRLPWFLRRVCPRWPEIVIRAARLGRGVSFAREISPDMMLDELLPGLYKAKGHAWIDELRWLRGRLLEVQGEYMTKEDYLRTLREEEGYDHMKEIFSPYSDYSDDDMHECLKPYIRECYTETEEYKVAKERFEIVKKRYEETPELYDHEPKLEFRGVAALYHLELTPLAEQLLNWYEASKKQWEENKNND